MEEKLSSYDWASLYKAAYEKEKKKNTILASKIADAEAKEADLAFRLGRIQSSIFWKLSAPARKCYHALKSRKAADDEDTSKPGMMIAPLREQEDEEALRAYRQELFQQKHPYLQWIEANENVTLNSDSYITNVIRNSIWMDGWQKIDLKDSELCMVICGQGFLDARAENRIKSWFNDRKNCLFAYSDEDYYWKDLSNRMHPWYKPCYSPDTLLAFCYIGHMIITKQSLFNKIWPQIEKETDTHVMFYDLCLRLEEEVIRLTEEDKERKACLSDRIGHIEEVLFHNCYEPEESRLGRISEAEKAGEDVLEVVEGLLQEELERGRDMTGCGATFCKVREAAFERRGLRTHLEPGPDPDIYHVIYEPDEKTPMVSVIIPSKDHPKVLEKCLFSFQEKTEYESYEWIVVDNGSSAENKKRLEELQKEYGFQYLYEPMEFNFSAMCNLGAKKATGEYLLFLNDDIEIIEKDWLRIMVGQAMQPHVGAVGAKLWYAGSNRIQHVGITNMQIGPSHKLASLKDNKNYYYGRNLLTYDMIGVTAACLLVGKEKYEEAGGLDESMKVAYNDVDFCFKLMELGYYNVLRNDAVLYHDESLSRGLDEAQEDKWSRLLTEKENLFAKHPALEREDPFYHKSLIGNTIYYVCNFIFPCEDHMEVTELSAENTERIVAARQELVKLIVDQAGIQRKIDLEEPDLFVVSGWCYLPGGNNACYIRDILLQREDGLLYKGAPFPCYRKDVEEVLTEEVNASLSGFVLRFPKEGFPSGDWKVGILLEHKTNHESFLTWSEKRLES